MDYKELTQNQIDTLLYFAYGYSVKRIAKIQEVSMSTIQQRIKQCKHKHRVAFDNACGIRNSYKLAKQRLSSPLSLDDISADWNAIEPDMAHIILEKDSGQIDQHRFKVTAKEAY